MQRGDHEDARRDLEEAAARFDSAAEIGRSDATLYLGSARAMLQSIILSYSAPTASTSVGGEVDDRVVERCRRASVAQPDSAAPYALLALVERNRAQALVKRGLDPRPTVQRAVDAAAHALRIDERDPNAYRARTLARVDESTYDLEHGIDPTPALEAAISDGRRLVELAPEVAHFPLGSAYLRLGNYQRRAGADPRASLRAAFDEYGAVESGNGAWPPTNQLCALVEWARYLNAHGESPEPLSTMVDGAVASCIRENPKFEECSSSDAQFHLEIALHQIESGQDPRAQLNQVAARLQKAREFVGKASLDLRRAFAWSDLGRLQAALRDGREVAAPVAQLRDSVTQCFESNRNDPECSYTQAEGALAALGEKPDREAVARAHSLALRATRLNPRDADALRVLAEVELRWAQASRGAEQRRHLEAGLAACADGLAINPNHPRLLATQGALFVGRMHTSASSASDDAAVKAVASLRRALALNPLLERDYRRFFDEATRGAPAGP
jgi:tetratricopeptide (TPR) repeat protein